MKKLMMVLGLVAGVAFAADIQISSNYRETIEDGANLVPSTTPLSVETLPDVGTRLFHFDAQQTTGWEFSDSACTQVTKVPSLYGERYAHLARQNAQWTSTSWPLAPTLTTDPTLGGGKPCLDFGAFKSNKGLVFNHVEASSNLLTNVGTVFMVINSEQGGGASLLGGGRAYYPSGYGSAYGANVWKRGTTKFPNGTWDFTDYLVPNARWYSGGGTDCAHPYFYNGTIWQDGLPTRSSRVGLNGGWQVIAISPAQNTLNFTGFALGPDYNGGDSTQSGGQRLAEVIVYDSILAADKIAEMELYLSKKWFGRVPAGYDNTARAANVRAIRKGSASYTINGAKVDVTVEAGKTLEIGQFQGGHGGYPTMTKNGEGTVAIGDMSAYQGTLVMNGGTFKFEKRAIPTELPQTGLYADMDASAEGRLDYYEDGGKTYVTNWVSSTGTKYKFSEGANTPTYEVTLGLNLLATNYPEKDLRPTLNTKAFGGKKTVDFGTHWEWGPSLQFVAWDAKNSKFVAKAPTGITTALMVINAQCVGGIPLGNQGAVGSNENYFEAKNYANWQGQKLSNQAIAPQGHAASNGVFYVNGVQRAPTAGYATPGWQVAAMQTSGSTVFGLGMGWSAYYGGGFEAAEVVLYNRTLSERELLDAQAYLSKKWFGRETPGYRRVDSRTAVADVPKMKVTAPSTVYVAEGDTMRVGELTLAATLTKTGAGTLEVESLTGGASYLVLSEGLVKGAAAPAQTASCEPAKDPSLWLDANDIGGTSIVSTDSNKVRMWHAKDGRNCGYVINTDNAPIYTANGLNGMPVVDFGAWNSRKFLTLGTPMESVRTVFVVGEFYQGGNLIGTRTREDDYKTDYNDFFRNNAAGQPILAMNNNNRQVWGDGSYIKVDGEATTFDWKPPEGEHHLIEVKTMAGCYGAALMVDNSIGAANGGKIAEIIVYERVLTERETVATRNYLMKKWFNRAEEALPAVGDVPTVALAKVDVPAGKTLTLDADTSYSINEITGAGTLVKNGAGTLGIANSSGFTGNVQVNGGKLKLTGQATPVTPTASDVELWFDAEKGITFEDGSTTIITNWASQATSAALAARARTYARKQMTPPTLVQNGLNGKNYVNFDRGQYFRFIEENTGAAKDTEVRLTDIKTAFWVIGSADKMGGGMLFGDSQKAGGTEQSSQLPNTFRRATTKDAGNPNGFPGYYPSDPLLADAANEDVKAAGWRRNAEDIDPLTTGLSGSWDIVSCCMGEGKAASADGLAYVGGHQDNQWCAGFQELAEVIVYNRKLTATEISATESYLAQKWGLYIGGVEAASTNGLKVTLAEGATLESTGRSRYVDGLDGKGAVSGDITLGGIVADKDNGTMVVDGTVTIPEGMKVSVENLSDTHWTPLLQATGYVGTENLSSAVFSKDQSKYRLRIRNGVLGVSKRQGMVIIF